MLELARGSTKFLSFSKDGDEIDDLLPGRKEDVAVDLLGKALKEAEMHVEEEGGDEEGDDAEDDLNAAWDSLTSLALFTRNNKMKRLRETQAR